MSTEETKLASDARYGTVVLPSIKKIAQGIVKLASEIGVPISKLVATKDDVKNAHNLNKYSSADARLTCTMLDGDITMIATRCVFGDNGATQSFDCPARACDRLIAIEVSRLQDACISERFADDLNNYTVQRSREWYPKYGAKPGGQTR